MAKGEREKKKEALQLLRNLQSLRVHVHTDGSVHLCAWAGAATAARATKEMKKAENG